MAMKTTFLAVWVVALGAALGAGGCWRGSVVRNPSPVAAAHSSEVTEQAILDALPKHGWTVEDVGEGRIVAFLSVRSHLLRCEISYDQSKVHVKYLDSDRLDAKRGRSGSLHVHRNVNTWMKTLAADIEAAIGTADRASGPG